jgi:hypothetical protein
VKSKEKIGSTKVAMEEQALENVDASAVADMLENFWRDVLSNDRSYNIWSGAGRIFLTIHDSGKWIAKADWSMEEVDSALSALRREIMADVEPSLIGEPEKPHRSRRSGDR